MTSTSESSLPRPTQQAYKPATREDTRNGLLTGFCCLVGFVLGLAIWRFGITGVVGAGTPTTQFNALIIALAAPLMLLAALWFFYVTWRDWKRGARFRQHKQRTRGTVTHLWRDQQARAWCVGYQYAEGMSAYQSVHKRRYDSLSIGDEIHVDYLPDDPQFSSFEPIRKRSPRKSSGSGAAG